MSFVNIVGQEPASTRVDRVERMEENLSELSGEQLEKAFRVAALIGSGNKQNKGNDIY